MRHVVRRLLAVVFIAAIVSGTGFVAPAGAVGLSGCGRTTVVLVHGAWADASSWSGEVGALQRAGCRVRAVANPVENLTTDSLYVADFLKAIPGPVVLVGHSYGGSVITNAAALVSNVRALV